MVFLLVIATLTAQILAFWFYGELGLITACLVSVGVANLIPADKISTQPRQPSMGG